jgi:hypothetical protein
MTPAEEIAKMGLILERDRHRTEIPNVVEIIHASEPRCNGMFVILSSPFNFDYVPPLSRE